MTILSKNKIKYIHSLEQKKVRKEEGVFLAEGYKLVDELIEIFDCRLIVATSEWLQKHSQTKADEIIEVTESELSKASLLKTPQQVLAIFNQKNYPFDHTIFSHSLCLALDDIQDPGNLGTIVRLADWFGIEHIFCSPNTVDIYNPKTVQATMGAIGRVKIHYINLVTLMSELDNIPIYGTFLDGENMYAKTLTSNGLIVMGNEGNGIGEEVSKFINSRLYIPNYPMERETSESLNVAIATAVVCAEFRRQISSE